MPEAGGKRSYTWALSTGPSSAGTALRVQAARLPYAAHYAEFIRVREAAKLTLTVGDLEVLLEEVGPAHTSGDVIVHVPARGLVFTGDVLFIDSTPIIWAGPVLSWIRACNRILELDAAIIVPGHGPITDAAGVKAVRAYLEYIHARARQRFDAGMDVAEAAFDIALGDYDSWGDAERIAASVDALYREFRGGTELVNASRRFELMARIDKERRARAGIPVDRAG